MGAREARVHHRDAHLGFLAGQGLMDPVPDSVQGMAPEHVAGGLVFSVPRRHVLPAASVPQNMQYAVQRLLQGTRFTPPRSLGRRGLISLMCSSFSLRMLAMAVSPSPLRGRLLRGRGSPERRVPCFEAVESDVAGHVQEILRVSEDRRASIRSSPSTIWHARIDHRKRLATQMPWTIFV